MQKGLLVVPAEASGWEEEAEMIFQSLFRRCMN